MPLINLLLQQVFIRSPGQLPMYYLAVYPYVHSLVLAKIGLHRIYPLTKIQTANYKTKFFYAFRTFYVNLMFDLEPSPVSI